ncbi:MAG TPA: transcription-repair coupling factor [Actinobacteria bacterium]|nr:transcription-repair coupling factor [Actinomycetota bacterium]
MIEYFTETLQWKKFAEEYRNNMPDTVIADEAIWPFIASDLNRLSGAPSIMVTSTRERAVQLQNEIGCLLPQAAISIFTGIGGSIFFKNKRPDSQSIAERLGTIRNIVDFSTRNEKEKKQPLMIIATASSLINLVSAKKIKGLDVLKIIRGREYGRENLIEWLAGNGYERVNQVYDRGEFSVKGDIISIFDITRTLPVRIDLLIDEAEKIASYNLKNHKNIEILDGIAIFPNLNLWGIDTEIKIDTDTSMYNLFDILKIFLKDFTTVLCDPLEVYLKLKSDIDMMKRIFERDFKNLIIGDKDILSKYLIGNDFFEKQYYGTRLDLISIRNNRKDLKRFAFSPVSRQKRSLGNADIFIDNIRADLKADKKIIISSDSGARRKKIRELLLENSVSYKSLKSRDSAVFGDPALLEEGIAYISESRLYRGFNSPLLSIYGELDIYQQMESVFKDPARAVEADLQFFKPGGYVVHKNHGIGIYIDTISRQIEGHKREYFLIEYGKGDRLYIPTWHADRINKYIGSKKPVITPLDSKYWDRLKKRVRKSVKKLAVDLAKLYAERQAAVGHAFPPDSSWQAEIEEIFPFRETQDQIKAIKYVKGAMESHGPMDVLVIGDVGFGKTEVAIRAAFKAMEDGKQVLMLVPTTILADQHFMTFSERYKKFPVSVDVVSRFRKKKEQVRIIEDFNLGKIDMLIGTHRILQKDVMPLDLGLIIIDEEQRFGVNSKEKIKLFKKQVDVLTLTATPIPRTLYMSMAGVKDMALIETYPEGRNPIETFVGEMDHSIVKNAIEREMARGGQVYYVYNRISDIEPKANQLARLLPEARIALAHGQMDGRKIEKIMTGFIDKKYDILLTTSIIESGMDIENVNTLIVENSHMFGLSQLYQLRGRVGRSSEQAYAYLFYPNRKNLSNTAYKRLRTLTEYTDLGSGYNIAMRDLEIRGAGEMLGPRQHGHINSVGYDMYCQIIKEEIDRLKGIKVKEDIDVQIDLPLSAYIPKNYISSQKERINIYRQLGAAENFGKIDEITGNLIKKYGEMSGAVSNLIGLSRIKSLMRKAGIESLRFSSGRTVIIKKVILNSSRADDLVADNKDILYQSRFRQVTIKNIDKKIDLDLVIEYLSDIISAM